jgi:serine/threonine protein kinase
MDLPNFSHISDQGKDFIRGLLVLDPDNRLTASQCLSSPWLTDNRVLTHPPSSLAWLVLSLTLPCGQVYVEVLYSLQTTWMKGILARRRWHRWYHAITAMNRMRKFSLDTR